MTTRHFVRTGFLAVIALLVLMPLAVACGDASAPTPQPTATPVDVAGAVAAATAGQLTAADVATAVAEALAANPSLSEADVKRIVTSSIPTPVPTQAPEPEAGSAGPYGTLDIGWEALQNFSVHPRLTPGGVEIGTTILETLLTVTPEAVFKPKIAESWELSSDQLTWTFKLHKGIQFHGGYGELTAEDVIYSIHQYAAEGSQAARAKQFSRLWNNPDGGATAIDDYTIEVNTGVLQSDMLIQLASPYAGYIVSKAAVDQLGEETANTTDIGSGSWELVEAKAGEWRMRAVENHWRKTPEFAELVFHEIKEEATQLANFQVGRLDTFVMNYDSIPAVMKMPGTKLMRKHDGFSEKLALYGNYYVGHGTDAWKERNPGYDANLAWISANPDVNSVQWENARKVRQALSIAIDRDLIVETLLGGEGSSGVLWIWESHEHRLDPSRRTWNYNPETARRLLAEAGYPNGFNITLTPAIRGLPVEVEACHAVGAMWEAIGVNVTINNVPFLTLRGEVVSREYQGATCQGTSGRFDPFSVWSGSYRSTAGFASGWNHPITDAMIEKGLGIVDPERQYQEVVTPMAEWIYDNAFDFALYSGNVVWPLGPEVDDWTPFMEDGLRKAWTAYEYAPHRK